MPKKLLVLVGTRPEVVKIAPFLRACRGRRFTTRLCTSGQHAELLEGALAEHGIRADLSFNIKGSLCEKSALCLSHLESILKAETPDALLVHGDTLTAFCGALAAFYETIPVLHLEAGLRTNTPFAPFPEELYRRTIDTLSTLCFAPTARAEAALLREGKQAACVFRVGNTVIDGLWEVITPDFTHPLLVPEKKLVLLTMHRRESIGAPLLAVCEGVREALRARSDALLLCPVHPNPAVSHPIRAALGGEQSVRLCAPFSRRDFANLLYRAAVVLTDSGGVCEEATALGVPTLVLREETERPEGVEAGVLFPVGTERDAVRKALTAHLDAPRPRHPSDAFGDGHTAERVASIIEEYFS
ncbi:MAG: UDP-N-acetylglucosamine 2-epimerase (non-hydrolyzing) [Clostridia bacterium]|nr:UDP-N-acetylglucosamine 2-epimerase (non-hydrolyzing) [Clostridia bacterium]